MTFFWRQLGGRLVRMPVVRETVGHQDVRLADHIDYDTVRLLHRSWLPNAPQTPPKKIRGARPLGQVDTLCIHQTGVEFGTTRRQRARWGGEFEALIARLCKLPYHWVVGEGFVLENHLAKLYTYHGNRANARSVGLGIVGRFPAFERQRKPKHTVLTDGIVRAGAKAIGLIRRDPTLDIRHVTAHRCWSGKRLADPGEEIWKRIVAPTALDLGLSVLDEVDAKRGGRWIPREWML